MLRTAAYGWSLLFTLLLVGCSGQSSPPAAIDGPSDPTTPAASSSSSEPEATYPYEITAEVEYYTTGPQQGRPPDGTLPPGTKVDILRRTGSYSLVKSADGIEGYVSSDAVRDPAIQGALP